jgi:hypothetical protein
VAGLLASPSAPQNLTISRIAGFAVLRWDISLDLDVRIDGNVIIRHSPDEAATWAETTSICDPLPGNETVAILPLKAGVYRVKMVDSSNVESTTDASVTTDQATALEFANLATITEHPSFSGTKTNCYVTDDGYLALSGSGLFDDITDLDAVTDLDGFGGYSTAGTYEFSAGSDLGSKKRVRITSHLLGFSINTLDKIDDRTELMDDWLSFDGDNQAGADAICYIRYTDDNPSGSPTWSDWHRLDSAEFYSRAFQFKVEISSQSFFYNFNISELSIQIEEVV